MHFPKHLTPALTLLLFLAPFAQAGETLTAGDIKPLISGKTTACLKTRDDSTCSTWFSEDGVVKRKMDADGKRKDGRWFVDDSDRLCILWDGKTKPLCLVVTRNDDQTYDLAKKGRHVSTITKFHAGNTEGL